MGKHKKLTVDEFKRRVRVAIEEPLPSLNGTRRSQPQRVGVIKRLLDDKKAGRNGGATPATTPQQERIVNVSKQS